MLALGGVAFVLFGLILVLVGTSQDILADLLGLDLAQTGLLGASVLLGIGAGVLLGGPLSDRLRRAPIFAVAAAVAGSSLLLVGPAVGQARLITHLFFMGLGGGLFETVLNTTIAERYGERSVRPLALLHSGANIGAIAGPIALRPLFDNIGWVASFRSLGAAFVVLGVAGLFVDLGRGTHATQPDLHSETPTPWRDAFTPATLLLTVVGFAYIGVESGFTLFAIPYAELGLGLDAQRGVDAISVFWVGLLVGRLALVRLREPVSARALVFAGGLGALALGGGTLLALPIPELVAGATGLALGGVFPVMIALAGQNSRARGTSISLVAGLGSLGGFAIPWLTGALGDALGIDATMGFLAIWCVVILAAALGLRSRKTRRKGEPENQTRQQEGR